MSEPVLVYRAWFHGAYEWGEGQPHTLGEPMLALPAAEFRAMKARLDAVEDCLPRA